MSSEDDVPWRDGHRIRGRRRVTNTLEVSPESRVDRALLVLLPLVAEIATVVGHDLPRMRNELAAALSSPDLTGGTSLESVEHDLSVRVGIARGKGTLQGSVTTQFKSDGGLTF